jgi:hypothetical protein
MFPKMIQSSSFVVGVLGPRLSLSLVATETFIPGNIDVDIRIADACIELDESENPSEPTVSM